MDVSPPFLFAHPEQVKTQAPWCTVVDNLELGVLLLAQPWLAADGLGRADLERQLGRLAADLPIGSVYFQRVKRTVARLVEIGAIRSIAHGRRARFATTPEGFATLVLNLRVLRSDPTLDGSEFELKRALVTMWHLVTVRLLSPSAGTDRTMTTPVTERFFQDVEALTIAGARVIDPTAIEDAFDVFALIARQRQHVESLQTAARAELLQTAPLQNGLPAPATTASRSDAVPSHADDPETIATVRAMAARVLPRVGQQAKISRYEHYLGYLDDLAHVLTHELAPERSQATERAAPSLEQPVREERPPDRGRGR